MTPQHSDHAPATSISLPNIRTHGTRFINVPRTTGEEYGILVDKHSEVISRLKQKLGFKNEKTVLHWLLEQIEQSDDIGKAINNLLSS